MTVFSFDYIYIYIQLHQTKLPNSMKKLVALISTTLSILTIASASAAELYWDPAGTASTSAGGTGTWDTNNPFWYNGSADIAWTNANNDDANFQGMAGTVTLTNNISVGSIYFTNVTGNYYITNLTGAEVLTVASTIDTGGSEDTIAALLASSGSLKKNGTGRLHLPVANTLGAVAINQGEISVENNSSLGSSATVADGAALELNGGTNDALSGVNTSVTINGSGITNSGALRNVSGVTTYYGQIILGENNSVIYMDSDTALVYDGENGPLTDNGNNYNLIISGSGTGNFQMGATSIGGSLIVEGPASCYAYLNSVSPTDWKNTYVGPGAALYVENFNGFGTEPATLITTNCVIDGGALVTGGTYTMYTNDGITVTANGGTITDNSGTWTSCNIYSSNAPVTFGGAGSLRPGGAVPGTLGVINLGTGAFIKSGTGDCNLGYANPAFEVYSNIVVNGGSLTFNYDSSGGTSSLGAVPSTLNASNIIMNGGSLHVGHSTTIAATRGILVTTNGGTIEDVVSSGGTVTINSPVSGPGSVNFPNGHSGVTSAVTFAANNTYAGTTTVGASSQLNVGSGSTAGTLGAGDTADNGILAFNRTGSYAYSGNITGSGVVSKIASGTVTLTGAGTYSGATTISAGILLIDNTNSSPVTVSSGGTLGGTGVFGGTVTVNSGGTLALGTGTLSASNNVSIAGNITVSVNSSASPSSGTAIVAGTLANTGTGTVSVSNLGPALSAGNSFQLFSQPVSGGSSMIIAGGNVQWANHLASSGSISVVGPLPQPVINGFSLSGTNLVISGTNGYTGGGYYVLATTNLLLPLSSWQTVKTNAFASGGVFSITNPIVPGTPDKFYTIKME
jgi:autotransporter-associated beta strand protein